MRKLLCILLSVLMLPLWGLAEGAALSIEAPAETIRPGKAILLTFRVPSAGTVDLLLKNLSGETVMPVVEDYRAAAGVNQLWWNGTNAGESAKAGVYQLALETAAGSTICTVVIGEHAPYMTSIQPTVNAQKKTLTVDFYASVSGLLCLGVWHGNVWTLQENRQISAGMNRIVWDASAMREDTRALTLTLTDGTGFSSNEEHITLRPADFGLTFATATPIPTQTPVPEITPMVIPADTPDPLFDASINMDSGEAEAAETVQVTIVPTAEPIDQRVFTPSYGSPYALTEKDEGTYWGTPMDVTDEEAVWTMLSAPFTYIDASYKGQTKVYAAPDEDSRAVAVVTGRSQGVRVLEDQGNGWTLIELYSSTFHDNSIQAWNMLVQGYVRTSKLKTQEMDSKYHIVVDKLTQRLYLFSEGKLMTTLLVSTGLSNEKQPYNETRSGEFLYISPTGGFWSDNMFAPMGMKFNDGDLLHEVPYVQRSGSSSKIYSSTEPYLGQRASHGCIRVQRKESPEGVNMKWIWDNRKGLGRIVIWEDWQGRQIPYPAEDFQLYYNADGGSYYHRTDVCNSAGNHVDFTPFPYSQLDTGAFAKLDFCPYCVPVLRKAEIDKINAEHAEGGDHDPILTAARQKYLKKIVDKNGVEALTAGELRYYIPADE